RRGALPVPRGPPLPARQLLAGDAPDWRAGHRPGQRQLLGAVQHRHRSAVVAALVRLLQRRDELAAPRRERLGDPGAAAPGRRGAGLAVRAVLPRSDAGTVLRAARRGSSPEADASQPGPALPGGGPPGDRGPPRLLPGPDARHRPARPAGGPAARDAAAALPG